MQEPRVVIRMTGSLFLTELKDDYQTFDLFLCFTLPVRLGVAQSRTDTKVTAAKESNGKPNVVIIYTDDQGTFDLNATAPRTCSLQISTSCRFGRPVYQHVFAFGDLFSIPGRTHDRSLSCEGGCAWKCFVKEGDCWHANRSGDARGTSQSNGYRTGHVGKWHLGYTPETMPNGQGFDNSFGHMGGCIDNYSHFFYWNGPNRHDLWKNGNEVFRDGEYFGDLMVDQCKSFIDKNKTNPFFLYWAINWPHYPMQGTGKWREKYKNLPHPRNKYATFVSTMDELIGKVITHLDEAGLKEDTIIVFQSDHGHSVEERAFFGGGNPGPFRGARVACLKAAFEFRPSFPGPSPFVRAKYATRWFAVSTGSLPCLS